jgi:hypothetical protein
MIVAERGLRSGCLMRQCSVCSLLFFYCIADVSARRKPRLVTYDEIDLCNTTADGSDVPNLEDSYKERVGGGDV